MKEFMLTLFMCVIVIGCTCAFAYNEMNNNIIKECNYYNNFELRSVPARCVSYFISGTEYDFSTTTNKQ